MSYIDEQLLRDANGMSDEAKRLNAKFKKQEFSRADYYDVSSRLSELETRVKAFSGEINTASSNHINKEFFALSKSLTDICLEIKNNLDEHFEPSDHY